MGAGVLLAFEVLVALLAVFIEKAVVLECVWVQLADVALDLFWIDAGVEDGGVYVFTKVLHHCRAWRHAK